MDRIRAMRQLLKGNNTEETGFMPHDYDGRNHSYYTTLYYFVSVDHISLQNVRVQHLLLNCAPNRRLHGHKSMPTYLPENNIVYCDTTISPAMPNASSKPKMNTPRLVRCFQRGR